MFSLPCVVLKKTCVNDFMKSFLSIKVDHRLVFDDGSPELEITLSSVLWPRVQKASEAKSLLLGYSTPSLLTLLTQVGRMDVFNFPL